MLWLYYVDKERRSLFEYVTEYSPHWHSTEKTIESTMIKYNSVTFNVLIIVLGLMDYSMGWEYLVKPYVASWSFLYFLFLHAHQLRFTFRLAFRRSFSSSYYCDQNTIGNGRLLGSGDSWTAETCDYNCSRSTIADTGFRCTDYSSNEDWSVGENNFTHTFSDDTTSIVRYVPLYNLTFSFYNYVNKYHYPYSFAFAITKLKSLLPSKL